MNKTFILQYLGFYRKVLVLVVAPSLTVAKRWTTKKKNANMTTALYGVSFDSVISEFNSDLTPNTVQILMSVSD